MRGRYDGVLRGWYDGVCGSATSETRPRFNTLLARAAMARESRAVIPAR